MEIRQSFSRLFQLVRRRRRLLAVVCLLLAAAVLAWPHVRARYHWRAAQTSLERFHTDQARAHLRVCLAAWPDSAEVHFLACRAARRAGAFQEAQNYLQQCKHLLADYSDDVILEGYLLHAATGNLPSEMENILLDRARKDPDQAPLILEALIEGYSRTYRVLEATHCIDRWLALQPDHVQAFYLRGNLWRHMNRLPKSVADFRRVLELDPERDDARSGLALGLLQAGRFEEALTNLETLQKKQPDDIALQVQRARCHKSLGNLDQARQILEAVLQEHSDHGLALRTRGEVEQVAGNAAAAEPWLRAAARASPYDYKTQWALFKFLLQEGKKKEAQELQSRVEKLKDGLDKLEVIRSQIAVRPNDPDLYCQMGILLLNTGHEKLGEGWLSCALSKDPTSLKAHAALADYYQQSGNASKANFHRRQVGNQESGTRGQESRIKK